MTGVKTKSHNSVAAHERLSEVGNRITKTVAKDIAKEAAQVGKDIGKDLFAQLLGIDMGKKPTAKHVEAPAEQPKPLPGVSVDIFSFATHATTEGYKPAEKRDKKPNIETVINYSRDILKNSEHAMLGENREMQQNIREIQDELRKLLQSSKVLQMEFAQVAVEQAPVEVGKYHTNFFEWMLIVLRQAREKVEDSGAWLSTVKGKNAKKGYWGMFKKHGTTFGLSNERSVSTQTG